MTPTAVIDRLAVTWRPDAEPGETGRSRLARLGRCVAGGALDDILDDILDGPGLRSGPGAEVCVRRVVLPVHRMRWDAPDDELVAGWAAAVGRAVASAAGARGPDVVRYAGRGHARRDLVTALLRGDREREWAWRMLGLWGPGASPTDAEVLRAGVAEIAEREPEAAVGLLVAVAGEGTVGGLVEAVGADAVTALIAAAWRAAGGAPDVLGPVGRGARGAPAAPAEPAATRHDPAGRPRPAGPVPPVVSGPVVSGPLPSDREPSDDGAPPKGTPTADAAASALTDRLVAHVRAHSLVAAAASDVPTSDAASAGLAQTLAAAAVLEVEPAAAAGPAAAATVSALAVRLTPPDAPAPPSAGPLEGRPAGATPVAARGLRDASSVTVPRPARGSVAAAGDVREPVPGAPVRSAAELGASTSWGGLLFLLPLVGDVDLPGRTVADPARYGPALRVVLHALARLLVARAVPDAGPAAPDDPAVLAFAGLAPAAAPPRDPVDAVVDPVIVDAEADLLIAALRDRLAPAPLADADERALLVAVTRRRAVIEADPAWIDVLLELDEVSVDVRRAGLDVDPGFLPWLGCVVRYRYG